jgi:hypothetical protein
MTWIADPLFNLVLRLNRFGRLALSDEQTMASNWVGGCLLGALLAGLAWLITGHSAALLAALLFGALVLPVAATFHCQSGGPRIIMSLYTSALAAAGFAGLGLTLAWPGSQLGSILFVIPMLGAALRAWVANFLIASRD